MMYTSQEGELYLSQARALGAIGVLPKQIKHADVSQVLQQLHLLGEPKPGARARRRCPGAGAGHARARGIAAARHRTAARYHQRAARPESPKAPPLPQDLRLVMEGMLAHHMLDVRRFISENLESSADRVVSDLRLLMPTRCRRRRPASNPVPAAGGLEAVAGRGRAGGGVPVRPAVVEAARRRRGAVRRSWPGRSSS
jgi:hypothetical protein